MKLRNDKESMYEVEYDFNGRVMRFIIANRTAYLHLKNLNLEDGAEAFQALIDDNFSSYVEVGEPTGNANGTIGAEVFLNIPDKDRRSLNKKVIGYLHPAHEPLFALSSDACRIATIHDFEFDVEDPYILLTVPLDLAKLNSTTAANYRFSDLPEGYWNSEKDQVPVSWKEFYNAVLRQPWVECAPAELESLFTR